MSDFISIIIAACLLILTIELSVSFLYMITFMQEAIIIARKVKSLEGTMEEKLERLESEISLLGAKIINFIFKKVIKSSKK